MGCFAQVSGWTCTSFETHTWDSQRHCSPFCLVVHVVFLFTSHIISSRALHRYGPVYCIATGDGVTNLVVWALRTHRSRMEALQLQLAQRISVSPLMWCDKTPEMRRRLDATCKRYSTVGTHREVNDRRDNLKPKQAKNTPNFADIGRAGASGRFFSITSSTLSQQNSKQIVHCAQLATLSPSFTWRAASVWWKRYALQRRVEMCWRGIPNRFLHSLWFDAGWRRVQLTWELWFCARPQSFSRNSSNMCQASVQRRWAAWSAFRWAKILWNTRKLGDTMWKDATPARCKLGRPRLWRLETLKRSQRFMKFPALVRCEMMWKVTDLCSEPFWNLGTLQARCSTRVVLLVSEICQPFETAEEDEGVKLVIPWHLTLMTVCKFCHRFNFRTFRSIMLALSAQAILILFPFPGMFASESIDSLILWHLCAFVGFIHLLAQVKDKASQHVWVFRFRTVSFHILSIFLRHWLQHLELHFCSSLYMSPISEGGSSNSRVFCEGTEQWHWKSSEDEGWRLKTEVERRRDDDTDCSDSAPQLRIASMRLRRKQQLQRSTGWKACGALDLCKALSWWNSINTWAELVEAPLREAGFDRKVQPLESLKEYIQAQKLKDQARWAASHMSMNSEIRWFVRI